jgi:hypothetical protein
VGDIHTHNPTKDLSVRHFENADATRKGGEDILSEADETIDLLNNERSRSF